MSSIANPRRTERAPITAVFTKDGTATAIASILLTTVLVSFHPFSPSGPELEAGGDIVNQLGFGSLGGLSIFALMSFADRRVLAALFSPSWMLLIGLFLFSAVHATDPAAAGRAVMFTLIGIISMATVLAIPRDANAFSTVIAVSGLVVVLTSYAGIVLLPDLAIHTAASQEPEHAGLWRGVFPHKNIAGPVMSCFAFGGLYLFRRGWRVVGGFLLVSAMIFMANTGSKTTVGLVPLAIIIVVLPGIIGMRLVTPILFAIAMIGTAVATLGIVFIEPVKQLAHTLAPDLTYTGRTTLWEFSGKMLALHPWIGYGYESFWGTPFLARMDQPFDRAWDIRTIVHGHDGYLDIAVIMGIPTLCVAVYTFLIAPLIDYLRIPMRKENIYLGDFFMMVLLFTALNAFLESFFFRRADPVWMFFVFSVLGLRLAARFPVKSGD